MPTLDAQAPVVAFSVAQHQRIGQALSLVQTDSSAGKALYAGNEQIDLDVRHGCIESLRDNRMGIVGCAADRLRQDLEALFQAGCKTYRASSAHIRLGYKTYKAGFCRFRSVVADAFGVFQASQPVHALPPVSSTGWIR